MHAADRGLKEAMLATTAGASARAAARDTIAPLAAMLLAARAGGGRRARRPRPSDVPLMHFAVGFIADKTRDAAPDAWQRVLTILLDGLRANPEGTTPMDGTPIALEDLPASLSHKRAVAEPPPAPPAA